MANLVEIIVAGRDQGAKQLMRDVGGAAQQQQTQFQSLAGGITQMAGKLGLAVTAGAAFKKTIGAGFTRLMDLENANKRLTQMGLTTEQIDSLMGGLTETVTGTAFKLNDAAGIMARFVSSGMDLDVVNKRLDMTADTAAFAQAPLNEIGGIFARIQTNGKLMGDELRMLSERGVPALELLASAAGVTGEEMRAMISRGEIDAERFFQLWEKGSQGFGDNAIKIAGAAQSMGDTTSGALANAETAAARLGAAFAESLLPAVTDAADGLTDVVNALLKFDDAVEQANKATGAADDEAQGLFDTLNHALNPIKQISTVVGGWGEIFGGGSDAVRGFGEVTRDATDATDAFAGATEDLEGQAGELTDELKSQQGALDDLAKTMFEAEGGVLNVRDAQRGLEQAIDDAADAIEENGKTLDRNTQEGRDNEAQLDNIVDSAHDVAEAQLEAGESGDTMRGSMARAREQFIKTATGMGMAEDKAEDLADQMGLIPSEVETTAKFRDEATRKISNLQAKLAAIERQINIRANISVSGVGGVERLAALGRRFMDSGGIVGTAQDGGPRGNRVLVGERRAEVVELPTGSRVIPSVEQATDRNQMAVGGVPAGEPGPRVNIEHFELKAFSNEFKISQVLDDLEFEGVV